MISKNRTGMSPLFQSAWTIPRGLATNDPALARYRFSPTNTPSSPSRTYATSSTCSCRWGGTKPRGVSELSTTTKAPEVCWPRILMIVLIPKNEMALPEDGSTRSVSVIAIQSPKQPQREPEDAYDQSPSLGPISRATLNANIGDGGCICQYRVQT